MATDGQENLDALPLTVPYTSAYESTVPGRWSAVAGQVESRGSATPELVEESYVYISVISRGTGRSESPFVAVLAPVGGNTAAMRSSDQSKE